VRLLKDICKQPNSDLEGSKRHKALQPCRMVTTFVRHRTILVSAPNSGYSIDVTSSHLMQLFGCSKLLDSVQGFDVCTAAGILDGRFVLSATLNTLTLSMAQGPGNQLSTK